MYSFPLDFTFGNWLFRQRPVHQRIIADHSVSNLSKLAALHCVVPENIHTPTTEGIGNSRGMGGQRPRNFRRGGGGGLLVNLRFQMVKFHAMQICFKIVSYLL